MVDNRHKSGHHVFPAQRVRNHHGSIFLDGFVQPVKRVDCLLKCFDNRNSTDVLYCGIVHVF